MADDTQKEPVEELTQALWEMEEKWKRALADYHNLEKRTTQQRAQLISMANASLLEKLLPIVDNLRRAATHLKDPGITMILEQFERLLKDEGVLEIQAAGAVFNPLEMECVEQVEGPKDTVITVREPGYRLGEFILRPAKVAVGNTEEPKSNKKDTKKEDTNE